MYSNLIRVDADRASHILLATAIVESSNGLASFVVTDEYNHAGTEFVLQQQPVAIADSIEHVLRTEC